MNGAIRQTRGLPRRSDASPTPCAGVERRVVIAGDFRVLRAEYAPARSLPEHTHDVDTIVYVVSGAFHEMSRRHSVLCGPRTILQRPAFEPHRNLYAESCPTRVVIVQVPPADAFRRRILSDVANGVAPPGRAHAIARELNREMDTDDAGTALAVEGLVLSLAASLARSRNASETEGLPASLERVREFIEAHCLGPIRLRELGALVHLHPVYLSRAFKRKFGVTPWQFQRRMQIDWVTHQLRTSPRSIAEIAFEAGFADHSHLQHAFRAATGRSPSECRLTWNTRTMTPDKSSNAHQRSSPLHCEGCRTVG